MSNSFFRFKQFTIFQDLCPMKVGTDAVLLGSWTNVKDSTNILDVGTGTGLISLMLAQRNETSFIDAIDINEDCVTQAKLNFKDSPFSERLCAIHSSLKHFITYNQSQYDLIISNPPFFNNSLKSPIKARNFARHDCALSFKDILDASSFLLKYKGRVALVLPFSQKDTILNEVSQHSLKILRLTNVYPVPHKPAKRVLVELANYPISGTYSEDNLIIEHSRHNYSLEFKELTKPFYLNL